MVEFHGHVSHRLTRARTLASWRKGRVSRDDICDADFLLVAAAKFHGTAVDRRCPICNAENISEVLWVYSDRLGRISGTARSAAEITCLAEAGHEFSVHNVEVCIHCKWNHLLYTTIATPSVAVPDPKSESGKSPEHDRLTDDAHANLKDAEPVNNHTEPLWVAVYEEEL